MPATDSLWDAEVVDPTSLVPPSGPLVANAIYSVISPEIDNSGQNSFERGEVTLKYGDLAPVSGGGGSYRIGAVLEQKDVNGNWQLTAASQFSQLTGRDSQPLQRVLQMWEGAGPLDAGVDDVVFPLDQEECRVSRSEGRLPNAILRIRILIKDSDPGGAGGFDTVTLEGSMKRWSSGS